MTDALRALMEGSLLQRATPSISCRGVVKHYELRSARNTRYVEAVRGVDREINGAGMHCIMGASGDVEQHHSEASAVFLLRTLLLCLPQLAFGICAGLGIRSTVADYVQGAITAYQYKYAADAGAFLQTWAAGTTPVLLGIAVILLLIVVMPAVRQKREEAFQEA